MPKIAHDEEISTDERGIITIEEEQRDWTQLPNELLENIIFRLYGDIKPFHSVCKSWHDIKDPGERDPFKFERDPLQFPVNQSQWLFQKSYHKPVYQFFHPIYRGMRYSRVFLQQVKYAVPRYSRDGWVLMSSGRCSIFFVNLFEEKMIPLPDLPYPYDFDGVIFSLTPTSPNCLVWGIGSLFDDYVKITKITRGDETWNADIYTSHTPFLLSHCTPVFHKGMVYCLGKQGNLGVYNPEEDQWNVLEEPKKPCRIAHENFLVDLEGEVISVFLGRLGTWIYVFKLAESKMVWEKVYTLGNYALFLSIPNSFSTMSVLDSMKNKIFLPIFHDDCVVFYSLDSKKFHTFHSNVSSKDLTKLETSEAVDICWIEPRMTGCSREILELDWLTCPEDETKSSSEEDETESSYDENQTIIITQA